MAIRKLLFVADSPKHRRSFRYCLNGELRMQNREYEIKLKEIKKTYVMGEVKVPVLKGINLELYKGKLTVILGPSGSGKSTLLNIIGGVDRPSSGEILFDGKDLSKISDRSLTQYRRKSIGFVFQFYNLVPTLTARENVQVSTEIIQGGMDAVEALEHVGLKDYVDYFPTQMSGGQQQRVAIARALAKNPRLMLCDEPTGALDINTGKMVLDLLIRLNKELQTTIVIISHASQIAQLAHRVIQLGIGVIAKESIHENPLTVEEISW